MTSRRSYPALLLQGLLVAALALVCLGGILYPFISNGALSPILAVLQHVGKSAPAVPGSDSSVSTGYVALARIDAQVARIPPYLFVRQIQVESGFNPQARSPAGAEGIAQFMPQTAAGLGIDPWNPTQALAGAAQLMGRYYRTYGSYAKALAAYNGGSGRLNSCLQYGAAWLSCEPMETQRYVQVIDPALL